jgi:hypothetical protein
MSQVTHILDRAERGDPTAAEELLPLVYEELRKLAAAKMAQENRDKLCRPRLWCMKLGFDWLVTRLRSFRIAHISLRRRPRRCDEF